LVGAIEVLFVVWFESGVGATAAGSRNVGDRKTCIVTMVFPNF